MSLRDSGPRGPGFDPRSSMGNGYALFPWSSGSESIVRRKVICLKIKKWLCD